MEVVHDEAERPGGGGEQEQLPEAPVAARR